MFDFKYGKFDYYVTESTAMGSGITIYIYKHDQNVAEFFSGTDKEVDFQSDFFEINFEKANSPIFKVSKTLPEFG